MKVTTPSPRAAISYLTRRFGPGLRRINPFLLLMLLTWSGSTGLLQAQDVGNDPRFLLMKSHAETQAFFLKKEALARSKDLERTYIPQYNIDLLLTVSRFHKHIADMHHRHVTCSICREHVKKIKQLSKKIDQGMK